MPPAVIDVQNEEDRRDVVHRAVQALAEGRVVGFPTETVYSFAASALSDRAVSDLMDLFPQERPPISLGIRSASEAHDYVPEANSLSKKLMQRGWPGPLTLQFKIDQEGSALWKLPRSVSESVAPDRQLQLRVPEYPLLAEVLQMQIGPVVFAEVPANPTGQASSAQDLVKLAGNQVPLILDDGECKYGAPSTIISVNESKYELLQAGVITEQALQRLASMIIVFVCTGNTCRSPMAEVICRTHVAAKKGCDPDGLEKEGIIILSAGVSAFAGSRASPEGVAVLQEKNMNLADHCSQPLTPAMIEQADVLLVMTKAHQRAILHQFPEAGDRVHLLCRDDSDIGDPIGGPPELYKQCAEQIETEVKAWIERWGL